MAPIIVIPSSMATIPPLSPMAVVTIAVCLVSNFFTVHPLSIPVRLSKKHAFSMPLNYATVPLPAALLLLAIGAISPATFRSAIVGGGDQLEPWAVLVLFFTMAYICISLDLTGILEFISMKVLQLSGSSGRRLVVYVFLLSSFMTLFTSNDVVIMTLTPIILYLSRHIECNPLPLLFVKFYAANLLASIWFMGNTTNLVVYLGAGLDSFRFSKITAPATLLAHTMAFAATCWYFRREIPTTIRPLRGDPSQVIRDAAGGAFLTVVVLTCLILLFLAGFLNLPVWAITSCAAGLALMRDLMVDFVRYDPNPPPTGTMLRELNSESHSEMVLASTGADRHSQPHDLGVMSTAQYADDKASENCRNRVTPEPGSDSSALPSRTASHHVLHVPTDEPEGPERRHHLPLYLYTCTMAMKKRFPHATECIEKFPYSVLPFLLGQFALVEALDVNGVTAYLAIGFAAICSFHPIVTGIFMTLAACFVCCVMSNLPTTILLTKVLLSPTFQERVQSVAQRNAALYALIMSSNAATCLALPACLAGLMWATMLGTKGVVMHQGAFAKVGFTALTIPIVLGSVVMGAMVLTT